MQELSLKEATQADVGSAVQRAVAAARIFAADRAKRAELLERIAQGIEALGDALLECASQESHLPLARLQGERGRTTAQLRLFAEVVREGSYLGLRLDSADKARQPLAKPDLRRILRPLGPVAIFGASNFPLAFSVAGGDTASALAAGCPVVHKAHPAHPKTAAMVGQAIDAAVAELGLPAGVFSLVQGASHEVGGWLASHPGIQAIGFTGSLRGGRAIFDLAAARQNPIPVYAEMGSVNPVFLLPAAVAARGEAIAAGLAGSVTMGVGQFCTNPGLVFVVGNEDGEKLIAALAEKLDAVPAGTMLYPAICQGYAAGVEKQAAHEGVEKRTKAAPAEGQEVRAALLVTSGATFAESEGLQDEVFGPATLVVQCTDAAQMVSLAEGLEGQLTATLQAEEGQDEQTARALIEILAEKAGRIVWNGFPTGVEVGQAMQHGGPYPATTESRSTSVGTAAIDRFLRPVAYQDVPEHLLPKELSIEAGNLKRLVNGRWSA